MGSKYPPQGKNTSRHETLGSRNLMEQFTNVRAKVDMYFGKVRVELDIPSLNMRGIRVLVFSSGHLGCKNS